MIQNAFTCTGPYAVLILYGIKRTENRSAWPEPREGRAAISCSKLFCKEEYGQFIAWASVNLPPEDFENLPAWREVKDWPGKVVGVCDYKARARGSARPESAPYQVARRLAEDMHRRGEASEGTLPKATRRARKRVRSPHLAMQQQRAKAGMKPPTMKCGAKKDDDSFWSRNGRKSERKDSR